MRFSTYRRPVLGILTVLFAIACVETAPVAWATAKNAQTAATKKAAATTARKKKKQKPTPAVEKAVEKPEVASPYSLQGRRFNKVSHSTHLDKGDAALYNRIFMLQEMGDFKKANEAIAKLGDHRLMGHVLFQRYTSADYKSTYAELAEWMRTYADLPKAQKIYDLAQKRKPKDGMDLTPPRPGRGLVGYHDYDSGQLAQPYTAEQEYSARERSIMKVIDDNLSKNPTTALNRLESSEGKKVFGGAKHDALQAKIAESYFHNDKGTQAYQLAAASSERSGKEIPLAGWIAGLAAWKQGKYNEAAKHFERTADSPRASAWMASAGAHWAARSYLRSHQPQKVGYWLHRSAQYPRSFYGIISAKALGMEQTKFSWDMPAFTNGLAKKLARMPSGKRAVALADAGRPDLAEQELRQINPGSDSDLQEALMALAHKTGMPSLEMRLGSGLKDGNNNLYDSALYPDAPWEPKGPYKVDKALVYAFIRQESKFDAGVSNKGSGATGLMQLLPSTAMNVARKNNIRITPEQLQDPSINIELGQLYLADLLKDENVKDNLFKLAVAYNAGPGKLARWEKTVNYADDPLLFIESIPVAETRIFVERVLTNYWIYRIKYNQNTDSLEKVASGEWPLYMAEDFHRLFDFADASSAITR